MRLTLSASKSKLYQEELEGIEKIVDNLHDNDIEAAKISLRLLIEHTKFRKKNGNPIKNLTKYIALKILEHEIEANALYEFVDLLWKCEMDYMREISVFILGHLYSLDPESNFKKVVHYASSCKKWNHIDNLVNYALEESIATEYDLYLEKLTPLLDDENQWIKRLAIVGLGRAAFITKDPNQMKLCLAAIETTFKDSRKIVRDANSWIIGTIGFRVNPKEVVNYFMKYKDIEDYERIRLFCDSVKRTITVRELDGELKKAINTVLTNWSSIDDAKIERTVKSALNFLNE